MALQILDYLACRILYMCLIVRLAANVPMGKLPILGVANAYIVIAEGMGN